MKMPTRMRAQLILALLKKGENPTRDDFQALSIPDESYDEYLDLTKDRQERLNNLIKTFLKNNLKKER